MKSRATFCAQESPQPEIIRNLPQPPILMAAGPAHMVVYARNKAKGKVSQISLEEQLSWMNFRWEALEK